MTLPNVFQTRLALAVLILLGSASLCAAQNPTSTGTLNVQLQNGSGLLMTFQTDPSGVTLGNAGTANATLALGTVSAYGTLATNITRVNSTAAFTISTPFDVNVEISGIASASYILTASLAAAAPTGVSLTIDSVTLSTTSQTVQATGTYGSNISHTLGAVISTSASGSGGPTTGTQLTSTINFTATAN